ncbi:MAG: aminodeoxychorismate synthase component I [Thermodesulfobacteriota bacterium]
MNKQNLLRQKAQDAGLKLRASETNPTPVAAFRALDNLELPFILGGAPCQEFRYSITGAAPFMRFSLKSDGRTMEFINVPDNIRKLLNKSTEDGLLQTLSAVMGALKTEKNWKQKGPFPFNGGAAGFFSYDLGAHLFNMPSAKPKKQGQGLGLPLLSLGFYDNLYIYDHKDERGYILSKTPETQSAEDFYESIEETSPDKDRGRALEQDRGAPLKSNTTKEKYIQDLRRTREYIADGEIYQINLSQRLSTPYTGDAFALYEGLLRENPTPFSSYFDFGEFQILSNSPERLLKVQGRSMETCPIKGTVARGATPAEDKALIKKLSSNIKERAEHVMIVDLERNDLGRVASPGTVTVDKFEEIQSFSKLHHMVSTVRGTAPEGTDPFMILKNIFPGGSITGAPKIRAMEIIEELESVPREAYTGGAGFIDYSGDMDLSILIRTAILKGGELHLHVGGGIVADSDPGAEYDETILKAMDFLTLLKLKPGVLA